METKKLYRSKTNRFIFGVAGGLGEYFGIDPTIVRIVFVILTIWGGVGIILYIIGIFLIPESPNGNSRNHQKTKNRVVEERVNEVAAEIKEKFRGRNLKIQGDQIFGLVLILLGLGFFLNIIFPFYNFWRLWPLILIAIGIVLIATRRKGSGGTK